MRLVHIGGAKGVGKTSTMAELSSLSLPGYTMLPITTSSVLAQGAQKSYGRPWAELGRDERKESRKNFKDALSSLSADVVFLDSHYVDIENGVPVPIMTDEINKIIDVHIVLEEEPSTVLERRIADISGRQRGMSMDEIVLEIDAEREEAIRLAADTGSPVHIFDNIDVGLSARRIIEISRNYLLHKEGEIRYEGTFYNRK